MNPVYPVRLSNSTIARLLCEEARYRWMGILEKEDVCVDDISCVVLELANVEPSTSTASEPQKTERHHDMVFQSLTVEGTVKIQREKAARNDPTRGSVADERPCFTEDLP